MSDYSPKFKPGADVTLTASADILGGQLVAITGTNSVGPTTGTTPAWFGVARQDAKAGERVVITRGGVQKLTASGAPITAGERVIPATGGSVLSSTGANAVGTALSSGPIGATVLVAMDR